MLLGYVVSGPDNGTYMYRGDAQPPRCEACGVVTDFAWVDPGYEIPSSSPDVSWTYDGRCIVSDHFATVATTHGGAALIALPQPDRWLLIAEPVAAFDIDRRGTRFDRFCETCRRFTQVAGATPVFLREESRPLADSFMRTDVEFGSGDELHPLILVGPALGALLADLRLTGLDLKPIESVRAP